MANTKRDFKLTQYTRISQPNNQMLAELTKKAMDRRTLAEFAELCNVSTSTIFRVVNGQIKSPLSDALIVAIAENASVQSGVTLEMMIAAHGLSKKEQEASTSQDDTPSSDYGSTAEYIETLCINLIRNHFMDSGYSIYRFKRCAVDSFDFSIETNALAEYSIDTWHFETLYTNGGTLKHNRVTDKMSKIFEYCYFNCPRKNKAKISLVIDSKDSFEKLKDKYSDLKFKDVISVILVDTVNQRILEEHQFKLEDSDFSEKIF